MATTFTPYVEPNAQKLSFSYLKTGGDSSRWAETIGYIPEMSSTVSEAREAGYIGDSSIKKAATYCTLNSEVADGMIEDFRSDSGSGNYKDWLFQSALNYQEAMNRANAFVLAVTSGIVLGSALNAKFTISNEVIAEEE